MAKILPKELTIMAGAAEGVERNWDLFNPEKYTSHNFAENVLAEDKFIIEYMLGRIDELWLHSALLVLNVGHGPNFYADMILQLLLRDDGILELVEFGQQNIADMHRVVAAGLAGDKGIWKKFEDVMRAAQPGCGEPLMRAWRLSRIVQGSIYELPKNTYEHGATFFCPESITDNFDEFERAVHAFLDSIKSGGFVIMAFMRGSEGYDTAGALYPAVPIECPDVDKLLRPKVRRLEVIDVPAPRGARPKDGPQYTGMGIATGLRI